MQTITFDFKINKFAFVRKNVFCKVFFANRHRLFAQTPTIKTQERNMNKNGKEQRQKCLNLRRT